MPAHLPVRRDEQHRASPELEARELLTWLIALCPRDTAEHYGQREAEEYKSSWSAF